MTELRHRFEADYICARAQRGGISYVRRGGLSGQPRLECGAIRVARLSPLVRRVIDSPNFSFGALHDDRARRRDPGASMDRSHRD